MQRHGAIQPAVGWEDTGLTSCVGVLCAKHWWPGRLLGTVHAAPHPPLRPRGTVQAALWGSGEEIAEPKALSSCTCFPVPVPGPCGWEVPLGGVSSVHGRVGKDRRGYFKFLFRGAVSGPVVRT